MSRLKTMNEAIYTGRAIDGGWESEAVSEDAAERLRTHIVETAEAYDAARQAADDNVNHPPHYKQGDIEAIDAIQAALTAEEFRGYCKGNALKYIWREKHKGQDESIRKAIWYLNRMLGE